MTLAFLDLSAGERKVYIDEAAARRGLAPEIVEKRAEAAAAACRSPAPTALLGGCAD